MRAGFMGDDWFFIDAAARADSAMVSFMPWNGRFTRPIVTFLYYVSYHRFGLWPVPLHLAVVLMHVLNAWLVCLLVLRLAPPPNRLIAAGAGLIFLLFAGHSEAVAWVAGMADVAVTPFLIGGLLLFDRALADPRPARWLLLAWTAGALGLFAKETAMILPALAAAYGVIALPSGPDRRRHLTRTAIFVGGALAICLAYWLFRSYRFGSALGAYTGMGTSEGQRIAVARMFLLRAFVPPGRLAVYLWVHYFDLLLFAGIAAAGALVALRDRGSRRGLAFVAVALFVALGPALPLSLSLATNLTERYLYAGTIFSCALMAWVIARLVRPTVLAAILIAAVAGVQWRYLHISNNTWVQGDRVFQSVVRGVADLARAQAPHRPTIMLLNMPDTIDRPYVDGTATFVALRVMPDGMEAPERDVRIVAMHNASGPDGEVRVEQVDGRFIVDVGRDTIVDGWLNDKPDYAVLERGPHRFTVRPTPIHRALVASWSRGQVRLIAEVPGTSLPFGSLDLPAADTSCAGDTVRFAGWALDDEDGVEVRVEREDALRPGSWIRLGAAEWRSGTRPDVKREYPGFASVDRAEWNYWVPCAGPAAVPLPARIRVVAHDTGGREVVLGSRQVSAGR
jgi:hypothetical protein